MAALFDACLTPEDSQPLPAMQEQTSMHSELVKGKKDHEYGPPLIWSFGGALKWLKEQIPEAPRHG
eukprot:8717936-Pyramimonas_sp.AAC.1